MRNLPFLEEILADLRRFAECVEDNNDVNLERSRFDLLVQLGLLERVQRSPARWMMTQAGEDAIAQPAAGEPVAIANRGKAAFWVRWTDAAEGLYGPGIKLYAAPPADGKPVMLLREVDSYLSGHSDNAICNGSRLHREIKDLLTATPAAAHGDEAVRKDADRKDAERYRWIAANVSEAEVGRSSEYHTDWRRAWKMPLLLSQNAVAATFTFDESIDAAMRAQGDGEPS